MGRPSVPRIAAGAGIVGAAAAEVGIGSAGVCTDAALGVGCVICAADLIAEIAGVATTEIDAAAALGVTATVAAAVSVAGCDTTAALGVVAAAAAAAIGVAVMAGAFDKLAVSS